ncbi:hypothetical protein FOMG_17876 [Fusarium oxysporum f. sp. melonis 26406]|uniref:Uncharacterized protein n=1 Tax=Fusarium oxysporum f. sp. melonis 26406 TaxID=1089452 RepID=W9Z101_FUSOX|nr:hypothetical protein FOMG_17876 [Fusarium oxysporum f. sp. melonis 26406]
MRSKRPSALVTVSKTSSVKWGHNWAASTLVSEFLKAVSIAWKQPSLAKHHKPFPPFFINICRTSATRNVRARASNARVTETVTALTPLANPETGEDIPNFPRINGDAQELNIRELGALLEVLGVRCNRTAERKRAAFFNAIGTTLMAH